jgi:hypothetical protein
LCPLTLSNPGTSARYAALKPPDAKTLISDMGAYLGSLPACEDRRF